MSEKNKEKLVNRLHSLFIGSGLDYEEIDNTRLWKLEEKIGIEHFSINKEIVNE